MGAVHVVLRDGFNAIQCLRFGYWLSTNMDMLEPILPNVTHETVLQYAVLVRRHVEENGRIV